jgi:Rieske 2Fe-2S family protein
MGRFTAYDGGATSVHFGPASFFLAYADHGVVYRFVPKTVDRSELEVTWLVRGDAREGVDYDLAALTWLWDVTSVADKRIIEDNQRGVASRFYAPGPYAPMEQNTRRYIAWYLREIA